MSAVVRKAATVIGAVASVAALIPGPWQPIAVGVAAAASITSAVLAKKPKSSVGGDQTRFTANKNQGLPYMMGRTSVSGFIAHRQTSGQDNAYQTFFGVMSAAGPIENIEAFKVDGQTIGFTGGVANGAAIGADYNGWMWLATQRGLTPEPAALASPVTSVPGWDATSKLSGYAAYAWTIKFDAKGKKYAGGVPEPTVVAYGVKGYDPRQDSTYPGGSGPQRANDESTWTYIDNAFLHGLTWLIGRHQNGKRIMGVGAPIPGIDVPAYVEACNIALANGWKMGGVVYSTDEKWAALKAMLQAGGGEPCRIGAMISCVIRAPRVSLDTIRSGDIVGDASVIGTQRRRERINAIVPKYRSEAHDWEMVPAAVVKVDAYVTEDGGQRTREVEYPLVQDAKLAAQLAAYDILDAREFGPIVLPLKTRWVGYKPGDCLTIDVPELNMVGQTAIVLNRSLDPSTGVVTLTLRSETPEKHDFALGRTATPPPTPSLQVIDPSQLLIPGISAVWGPAIADPNGTKPDDNATNSADPDSPFGNTTVGLVAEKIATYDDLLKTVPDIVALLPGQARQTLKAIDSLAADALRDFLAGDVAARAGVRAVARAQEELTETRTSDQAAEATRRLALIARVENTAALLVEEGRARVDGDEAEAYRRGQLAAVVGEQAGLIDDVEKVAVRNGVVTGELGRTLRLGAIDGAEDAEAALRALLAGDTGARGRLREVAQFLEQVTGRFVAGEEALVLVRQALLARIADTEAGIVDEREVRASAVGAVARALEALSAAYYDPTSGVAKSIANAVTALRTEVGQDFAKADRVSAIETSIGQPGSGILARVGNAEYALSDPNGSVAQRIGTVQGSINGVGGRVDSLAEVVAGVNDKTSARFQQVADIGGTIAGVRAVVERANGTTTSDLALIAKAIGLWLQVSENQFVRAMGLEIENGQPVIRFYGEVLANSIRTSRLVTNATVIPVRARSATVIYGKYATTEGTADPREDVLTVAIDMPHPGWIEAQASMLMGVTQTNAPWFAAISFQGEEDIFSYRGGGLGVAETSPQGAYYAATPGTYTVSLRFAAHTSTFVKERYLFVKGFPKTE